MMVYSRLRIRSGDASDKASPSSRAGSTLCGGVIVMTPFESAVRGSLEGSRGGRFSSRRREAIRWQSDHVERGRDVDQAPTDPLTIITQHRILYTEHWLARDGYQPRQTWRPAPE